jgi:hypothetical protein
MASLDYTYEHIYDAGILKQLTNKEAEAYNEALPLDENAAIDVVSITKSKTAKRKKSSGASSLTSKTK